MRTPFPRALAVLALGLLAACGGGDDPPPSFGGPDSQSGRVAAGGYLANAIVFLDLDGDNELDSNERRTVTDAEGRYTLRGLTQAQLAQHSIVVRVLPETRDVGTGQSAGLDCTLKAPPGDGAFVSPLSTLVGSLVAGGLSPEAAAAQVAQKVRASTLPLAAPAQLDVLGDYVGSASADSRQVRRLAASVAGLLSAVTSGLNARQSVFDASQGYAFDTLVSLTEAQLTAVASGTYQFSQLDAAVQARMVSHPQDFPNYFVDGNAMLAAFIADVQLSSLLPDVRDFIVNSDTFIQFFAPVTLYPISLVAELLLKILF